ncbi:MAG: NAD(P)-dependent oxidoreductase [Chloroflexota bacterium]|nr:MAG: NAD(P)-dependent oxidoreductase [Chloroflexota bacterium]
MIENLTPNPEDIYDLTKLEAEQRFQQASEVGLNTIIFRMSRCFPEPDHLQIFYRLYRGVGDQDTAAAHWLAVSSTKSGTVIINISVDPPFERSETRALLTEPWEVIERIYPGTSKQFDQLKWKRMPSIDRIFVFDKAKWVLNYQPRDNFWRQMQSKKR